MSAMLLAAAFAPARAETLQEAIATAYRTNPQLLAARAETRASDAVLAQAHAAYGPNVAGSAAYAYTATRTELSQSQTIKEDGFAPTYEVTLSQPLFTSGRLSASVSGARAGVLLAREQLRVGEQSVLGEVIDAYVSVRRDQQLLAIAQQNLELLGRQRSDSERRLRVRETTSTDAQQTENRYFLALGQLAEAQGRLQASRAAYTSVVGHPPGELAPEPDLPGMPGTVGEAYAIAAASSPILLSAEYRELQSRAGLAAARAQGGPTVAVEGTAVRDPSSAYDSRLRSERLIGRVVARVPLFNSGLIPAQVREARELNDRDWRLSDQARRDVQEAVARYWEQLNAVRAALTPYRQAVAAAEQAFAGAKEQERVGLRATIEVLDQARDLLQTRTALVDAQANEYLARTALLAAMGRLQAPLLVAGTPAYDPAAERRGPGGIPGLSDALQAVDSVVDGDLRTPRGSRDDAVPMHARPD